MPPERIVVESRALDSYQNVLFSILAFRALALKGTVPPPHSLPQELSSSYYPTRITIVSHAFKRARFLELHLPALRWPIQKGGATTTYIGIDPPDTPVALLHEGERKRGYGLWKDDPYGTGDELRRKREGRDPWGVASATGTATGAGAGSGSGSSAMFDLDVDGANEAVKKLLDWQGPALFPCRLPWAPDGRCLKTDCAVCRKD